MRPAGLEPATFWFVAKHSIQLSYERTIRAISAVLTYGGEQGIRTLDTGFSPYTRLAGERLRPTRPTLHIISGCLAEEVGFEPTELTFNGFQDRHLKPLGHPSKSWM